jgi:hypothetical protein
MEPELEAHWNDGLRAALEIINRKIDFEVIHHNLFTEKYVNTDVDFILGWGAFNSPVDKFLFDFKKKSNGFIIPKLGLCIAGNAFSSREDDTYDVLFYETEWYKWQISWHKNIHRAFGINDDIFYKRELIEFPDNDLEPLYDFVSVGSFSQWKRHELIAQKIGARLVIGQIQRNNAPESMGIIASLLAHGVAVSDMVSPEKLALIYNLTDTVYIPAAINGGGERAVWEALSCGCRVDVEDDNPKLKELLNTEPTNHRWYASALMAGIRSCLK